MKREMSLEEYAYLVEEASQIVSPYLVGFVKLSAENGKLDASIGGSGTLVSVDEARGVLTAAHVVRYLMRDPEAGLVLPTGGMQRIVFKTEYCKEVLFEGKEEGCGPDLAFMTLPPDVLDQLQAIMSFYNLSKQAAEFPPIGDGFWGIAGFAEEMTGEREPPKGFSKAKLFRGSFGAGEVIREYARGGFDYIDYEVLYNEFYEGPESFGGFSGGGLWQVLLNLKEEKPRIRDRILSGVAFFQTDKLPGDQGATRKIICHGRASVYQRLIEAVRHEFRKSH